MLIGCEKRVNMMTASVWGVFIVGVGFTIDTIDIEAAFLVTTLGRQVEFGREDVWCYCSGVDGWVGVRW